MSQVKICIMLGTPCTFLGPSRKRGPPKGYIDAIEARLHQTEALLGILIASNDDRARGVLDDMSKDALAKEIINRVDNSPYGSKGRKGGPIGGAKNRPGSMSPMDAPGHSDHVDLHSTHPSNEWQDRVVSLLNNHSNHHINNATLNNPLLLTRPALPVVAQDATERQSPTSRPPFHRPDPTGPASQVRRQRPKVEFEGSEHERASSASSTGFPLGSVMLTRTDSPNYSSISPVRRAKERLEPGSTSSVDSESEDDVVDAVGQLSLNEDEQVRYHGKASGLYLLGYNAKAEARNEAGIWRFPKARVWPPLPPDARSNAGMQTTSATEDDEFLSKLPEPALQEHLLDLYFTYVHPVFPILHKAAFFETFRNGGRTGETPESPASDGQTSTSPSPFLRQRRRISPVLLLTMCAIAARYSSSSGSHVPPPEDPSMWTAGDEYLNSAKVILDSTYASSRPSTCQALLLMGYREIGIGAMAQAWVYTGMAVRMAQDLGMHRSADGWARVGLGGRLFSEWELQERRRIWYACVILDKYVSTYIGRPLAIFEKDFDTQLPSDSEPEELELWSPHSSPPIDTNTRRPLSPSNARSASPVPGHVLSCFNASATLSGLLSMIVQAIYAIRPTSSRHAESLYLEGLLDKWYLELPEHLRFEPGSNKSPSPAPHVLTLHMQYWCTNLLLHRPFIRQVYLPHRHKAETVDDADVRATSKRNYELCVGAANHIASIVSFYRERYCVQRAPVFLCFYVFTAGIMHVTSLSIYPNDPQARMGLNKCMDALHEMELVWPSAARARELLRGSKVITEGGESLRLQSQPDRHKRAAEHAVDGEDAYERSQLHNGSADYPSWRSNTFSHPMPNDEYHTHVPVPPPTSSSSSIHTLPYFSSYERWPSDNSNYLSFPGTLSTSVLPQMYSTGLIDERSPNALNGNSRMASYDQGHNHSRYPQFWSDYTAFPQMGMAYGNMPSQSGQVAVGPPPSEQQQQQQGETSPMYLSSQYNHVYNNQPSS
ncbi:hypothetical protein SERLADRAFT_414597 [Serpula lacrymans var. lacrymans S7.9]|uniref:Xylanolytic transcriptional activator regulatory domain-containing protein n=1 Tax=Serpula lacrymans var. lacrymans (strain S7.9) TaxID=578457 RepID=F8NQV1_SERL9|nr:uncharacterized protein SERLADRAFT_414597 [Serpula lacrymans var. lacrymans S7.9]EGO26654.1 hypothetical protein SERLADRAFT_414597 [Serpula lacrymans var. lacrymans S7.9]